MIASEKPNTYQKALSLNLDSKIFAPFAEIGAGQEVAPRCAVAKSVLVRELCNRQPETT